MPKHTPAEVLALLLRNHSCQMHPILDIDLSSDRVCLLDFTARNPTLPGVNLQHTPSFEQYVQHLLALHQAEAGIGGYLEPRLIYRRSGLFGSQGENRSIHLGVDVWAPAGTAVYSPLEAVVHSFADNAHFGDYGPTIILEHRLEDLSFFTLYGHLSLTSLTGLCRRQPIKAGERFAEFGPYPENGDWPPHLHFQVMADLEGREGDFPGVAAPSEVEHFQAICPNPNLILRSRHLKGDE
jgi:murein DD-endopeptidase MepM/ murein hydrolase activator NlpD